MVRRVCPVSSGAPQIANFTSWPMQMDIPDNAKQLSCSFCSASFSRPDHLRRHRKLHTKRNQYQCHCGRLFSRSDVLARHLRECREHQIRDTAHLKRSARKNTRTKSACDRCAKSKLKCDSKRPCNNCARRAIPCEYTREGYSDPYKMFQILSSDEDAGQTSPCPITSEAASPPVINFRDITGGGLEDANITPGDLRLLHDYQENQDDQTDPHQPGQYDRYQAQQYQMESDLDPRLLPLPADGLETTFGSVVSELSGQDNLLMAMDGASELDPIALYDIGLLTYSTQTGYSFDLPEALFTTVPAQTYTPGAGFLGVQIDPVEAKCAEIRDIIKSWSTDDTMTSYITRDNVVHLIEIYGKYHQANIPILHGPTFNLVTESPVLILSMLLVGTCYSPKDTIPTSIVNSLAINLVAWIDNLPHEKQMQAPPLPIIQASIVLSSLLVFSQEETMFKMATVHNARKISMAERAGLFNGVEPVNYTVLSESQFDWDLWIYQEACRRLACQIFCQDIGRCIFMKQASLLLPLGFHVYLPSNEKSWDATTATECFRHLQVEPRPSKVSDIMSRLLQTAPECIPVFQASSFGMFTTIIGVHAILFQTIQNNVELLSGFKVPVSVHSCNRQSRPSSPNLGLLPEKATSISGGSVARLANEVSSSSKVSDTLACVNKVLNTWRASWDAQYPLGTEESQHEVPFSNDALRFWWLAKLYIVLYSCRASITEESEFFPFLVKAVGDEKERMQLQSRVVTWLMKFRDKAGILWLRQRSDICQDLFHIMS